jgi:type I restriction enzyme S subunit
MSGEAMRVEEASARYLAEADAGDVPAGYKRTEVGVIPEDWDCRCLRDMATRVGSGITPTGGARVYTDAGRPFLRSQNIGWGELALDDLAYITDETHSSFQASEIREGDVLLNITGASIGRSAVADARVTNGNVNQHVCEIRTERRLLDPHFLNAYLLSENGQKQIDSFQAGGNRQGLNYGQIRSFLVPRPSIAEQRAIAEALSDVDGLLDTLGALIAKKRAIKQAAMQQLLTGKTRLPGFSGEWETKRLGEVAPLQRGFDLPTNQIRPGLYPVVYSNGILQYHHQRMVRGPGVVTGRSGTIGKVHFIERDYWPHNTALWVTSFRVNDPKFVFYLFTHIDFTRFVSGSGVPTLNRNDVHQHVIACPTPREQTAIATVLSDMDAEIAALEARRDKTRAIKQGMMQQLLTGRVRLVQPSQEPAPA